MSSTKTVKTAAVKSTTKAAAVETKAKSTRKTVDDAQLKGIVKVLMGKGTTITTKSGLLKAVRAKGISVKGARVRSLFAELHKATKSQASSKK